MSRTKPQPQMSRDPVELLLRRIARRGIAGRLLGGAASLAVGCSAHDGTSASQDPVQSADRDAGRSSTPFDAQVPTLQMDGRVPVSQLDGGSGGDFGPSDAGETRDASLRFDCTSDMSSQILASSLQTSETFDYVAVRKAFGTAAQMGADAGDDTWTSDLAFQVLSERGTPCATATTPACVSKVAKSPVYLAGLHCVQACSDFSVVTTRGDDVQSWSGAERLQQLLAPIDAVDEIQLLLLAAGYMYSCGSPVFVAGDGYEVIGTRYTSECAPIVVTGYRLHVARSGALTVLSQFEVSRDDSACIGRIPEGLKSFSVDLHQSRFGDHLAHCAHLEAASVVAFERLAQELRRHDAPQELIEAALDAALDEVRHARVLGLLARAHGGAPSALQVDELPARTLEQIALENATEGCVRETYGALVGAYQAEQASDGPFAQAMLAVADDEARHASLSHRIHAWIMPLLTGAARERVRTARILAIQDLLHDCAREPEAELRSRAGLPSAALALEFVAELSRELWLPTDEIAA